MSPGHVQIYNLILQDSLLQDDDGVKKVLKVFYAVADRGNRAFV